MTRLEYLKHKARDLTKGQIAFIIVGVMALWLLSGIFANTDEPEALEQLGKGKFAVQVQEYTAEPVYRLVVLYGRTEATRIIDLFSDVEGKIETILAPEGSIVQEGTVLLTLEERDRRARLAEAKARVNQRDLDYAAQKQLVKKGYAAKITVAEKLSLYEEAKAKLAEAELAVERMEVRAPFNGIIDQFFVEEGQLVRSNDTVLARFVDNDPIVIEGQVSEFDFPKLRTGQQARVRLAGERDYTGTIRHISMVAAEETHTFRVEITVPNAERLIPSGVTAEMEIPVEEVMAHKVSMSMLSLGKQGEIGIKTVNDKGVVAFNPIDIVRDTPEGMWISGLPKTVTIVTLGGAFVEDGEEVDVRLAGVEVDER